MWSLGAWRIGLGCSGKILPLPSPPSPSPPSPTRIWEMGSSRVLLRNRRFRSARIDPSRLPVAEAYTKKIKFRKKNKYQKTVNKNQKRANIGIA